MPDVPNAVVDHDPMCEKNQGSAPVEFDPFTDCTEADWTWCGAEDAEPASPVEPVQDFDFDAEDARVRNAGDQGSETDG